MNPVIARNSMRKNAELFVLAVAFVLASGFMLLRGPESTTNNIFAWAGILFFGSGGVLSVRRILDRRARLIIDRSGIRDNVLGLGLIPWSELAGIQVTSNWVGLHLLNPEKWKIRMTGFRRSMSHLNALFGLPPFTLDISFLDMPAGQIADAIHQNIRGEAGGAG